MTEPKCVCTGIRKCAICDADFVEREKRQRIDWDRSKVLVFCVKCSRSFRIYENEATAIDEFLDGRTEGLDSRCLCGASDRESLVLGGLRVVEDYIDEEEESSLLKYINDAKWVPSQNGRFKQDFGPKANFNKKKLKFANFSGLPDYSRFLVDRFKTSGLEDNELKGFVPVELCNLRYDVDRGACIDPHYDDRWLWGPRLVTVNLLSNTFLVMSPGESVKQTRPELANCEVLVPLKRRSLVIVDGEARYEWLHSIKRSHIRSQRLAITLRELTHEFKSQPVGSEIESLALTFKGVSVGFVEEIFSHSAASAAETTPHEALDDQMKDLHASGSDSLIDNLKTKLIQLGLVEWNEEIKFLATKEGEGYRLSATRGNDYNDDNKDKSSLLLRLRRKGNASVDNQAIDSNEYELSDSIIKAETIRNFLQLSSSGLLVDSLNDDWELCVLKRVKESDASEGGIVNAGNSISPTIGQTLADWRMISIGLARELRPTSAESFRSSISNSIVSLTHQLKSSKLELSFKSKSVACLEKATAVFRINADRLNSSTGLILNIFCPGHSTIPSLKFVKNSSYLQDLASCLAIILSSPNPNESSAREVIRKYSEKCPLDPVDRNLLYWLTLVNLVDAVLNIEANARLGPEHRSQVFDLASQRCMNAFEKLFYQSEL